MKLIKVSMFMEVEDEFAEEAMTWEHYTDFLSGIESNPEIRRVYNIEVSEIPMVAGTKISAPCKPTRC